MSLDAHIGVSARGVNASITVPTGQTLALLGPNGAGKTTVIEVLAGLIAPDSGHAVLAGSEVFSSAQGRVRLTDSRPRGIALVTQDAALFPHLSVLDNVAFPARARGATRSRARKTATEWLARVDAGHLGQRKPRTLSGGESRRVAVARALASEPLLVLLDEPFASLDVEATIAMRSLLREVLAERTTIISTHNGLDAIDLADSIAVLDSGVVVEEGPTAATFEHPRTAFTAAMSGLVWLQGTWKDGNLVLADGQRLATSADAPSSGSLAAVALDPRLVAIVPSEPDSAGHDTPHHTSLDIVRDTVRALEPRGDGMLRVRGDLMWADVSIAQASRLLPHVGEPVHFQVTSLPHAFALTR